MHAFFDDGFVLGFFRFAQQDVVVADVVTRHYAIAEPS
jgi:hypothetical protein